LFNIECFLKEKNSFAESERLAAERLLEETKDLIKETKFRTRRDAQVPLKISNYKSIFYLIYW